jgi:large subunit ribosomal protein L4
MKAAALRGALSDRARNGNIHVLSSVVEGDSPSTKQALAAITSVSTAKNILVVVDRTDFVSWKSLRNVDAIHLLAVDQLNTYDVLKSDDVVFTKAAFEVFVAGPARGKSVKAVAGSNEVEA